MRNYKKESFKVSNMFVHATKEVKYFDLINFKKVDGVSINTISESTDRTLVVAKK